MRAGIHGSTRAAGTASSSACLVFSLAYVLAQLAEWAGWLGSAGGPEGTSTPFGLVLLLTPSLLLGPSFLMAMVSLHDTAEPGQIGHAFHDRPLSGLQRVPAEQSVFPPRRRIETHSPGPAATHGGDLKQG